MADCIDDKAEIHQIIFETPDNASISCQVGLIIWVKIQAAIQSQKVLQHHMVMNNMNKQAPRKLQHIKYWVEDATNNKELLSKTHLSSVVQLTKGLWFSTLNLEALNMVQHLTLRWISYLLLSLMHSLPMSCGIC